VRDGASTRRAYVCMAVVLLVYAVKVVVKLLVGHSMGSAAMVADGFHNVADIVEALLVVLVVYVGARPENEKLPLGRTSIDSILSLLIGLVLGFLGLSFLAGSMGSLFLSFGWDGAWSDFLAGLMPGELAERQSQVTWVGLLVAGGSAAISLAVSRYQIRTGRSTRRDALVADGKETLSDSLVEASILAGLVGSWLGFPVADRLAGILVSFFILRTSWGILSEAFLVLLNAAISKEEGRKLKERVGAVKGVRQLKRVIGYRIGRMNFVVLSLRVAPDLSNETLFHMRRALEGFAGEIVPDLCRAYVHFEPPVAECSTVLIPVAEFEGMESVILAVPDGARFIRAELVGSEITRAELLAIEAESGRSVEEVLEAAGADRILLGTESQVDPGTHYVKVAGILLEDILE